MLLILEIILTVKSWKNGWKALALIPCALALFVGFIVGASVPPGSSSENLLVMGLIIDLVSIAILGVMAAKAPQLATTASSSTPAIVTDEHVNPASASSDPSATPSLSVFAKRA